MAELKTKEAIMEQITALQHDLDTRVMSAEKEYRTRFEVSDLKHTLLQMEMSDLKRIVEAQGERIRKAEQVEETIPKIIGKKMQDQRSIKELQKQIEHLQFKQQTEVYSTVKERELSDKIKSLRRAIQEIEEGNPAYYRKNSW